MTNNDFDGYYRRYRKYVHTILFNPRRFVTLSYEDREDLEQSVWLRVLRYDGVIYKPDYFQSWLFRLTYNVALDFLRTTRRKHLNDSHELTHQNEPTVEPIGTTNLELNHILQRLNRRKRMIVELRFLDGMTITETARLVNVSTNIVRVTQHRTFSEIRARAKRIAAVR
jgi:RNA polymerase sigma-70 factor (ECF subfamily)